MEIEAREALIEARRRLREMGPRGVTTAFPQHARRAVVAYVEAARDEGLAWWRIAEAVGLSETALRRWREEDGASEHVALLPVSVVADKSAVTTPEPARGTVTLVTPGGYRVEGLGVEQLAVLLVRIGQ